MRILVTGVSGRIGRAIHAQLAQRNDVVGFDRSPSAAANVVADLLDVHALRTALRGADAVVHTAALHAPHVGLHGDAEFRRVNVEGTRVLAELALEAGVTRFVFTSTTALYGSGAAPGEAAMWIDETVEPHPRTIYHETKLEAENLLASIARQGTLAVTAIRMSRCFPEPAPVMAVYRLHRGIDARDVALAHELALQHTAPGFRKFVVSGSTPFLHEDMPELASSAPTVLQRRAPALVQAFAQRGWRLPASIDRVYSPALAQRDLAWQPRHGFAEVLAMFDAESLEVLPPGNAPPEDD
jgi:UDP-glucose 4-epimerase